MEQNNYSLTLLLVVIFLLSFVKGFFVRYPVIFWNLDNIQNFQIYSPIFTLINIIISPILLFIIFYKIGNKFDLKSNLKSTIIRLLIGAYVGHFLADSIVRFFSEYGIFWLTLIGNLVSLTCRMSFVLWYSIVTFRCFSV